MAGCKTNFLCTLISNNLFIQLTRLAIEKTLENNQIIYAVQKTFIVIVIVVVIIIIIIIISIIILCLGFDGKDVGNGQHNITGSTA